MTGGRTKNKISVIGLGFVGLSLAIVNAKKGFKTIGVDISREKITNLKKGKMDFFEPRLDTMLIHSMRKQKIQFTTDIDHAIQNSDVSFLTVGTPLKNNKIDLSYIKTAIHNIRDSLRKKKEFHLLVIKSTLPPMTTKTLILPVFEDLIKDKKMDVVVNPEFLREGRVVDDLLKPHLIVIGSDNLPSSHILEQYYRKFYKTLPEILHTNPSTAELIKYANNAFLATKISFINFIGTLCQNIPESDVNSVAYAIGKDSRIGPLFLKAGPGFGGSCLPKDLVGLINFSEKIGKTPSFFKAVKEINDQQFFKIIELMKEQNVLNKDNTVTVLGLAFKKNTDDIRGAASIKIVTEMLRHNLKIRVHDPMALKNFKEVFGTKISYFRSLNNSLMDSDCCVILTEWDEYKNLTSNDFIKTMRTCNIIDARRVFGVKLEGVNFMAIGQSRM